MINYKLVEIIKKIGSIEIEDDLALMNKNLVYDLMYDSMQLIQLYIEIEKHFNIKIEYKYFSNNQLENINRLNSYINEKSQTKNSERERNCE